MAAKLRRDILSGKIAPGVRLTEIFFSEKYAVSRTPVREALRELGNEQLIKLLPNRGAVVVGLSKADIRDLYQIREQLEVQAARWAAVRFEQEELEAIEQTLEFMEFYTRRKDAGRIRELGVIFHQNIRDAAHNRQLCRELTLYHTYLNESKHTRRIAAADLDAIYSEHAMIFEAIASSDADAGSCAMQLHIQNAQLRAL